MSRKLKTKQGKANYKRRKHTVEPVFGMIKHGRGMRQFLTRGLENVQMEWKLASIGHNLSRLAASGYRPSTAWIPRGGQQTGRRRDPFTFALPADPDAIGA